MFDFLRVAGFASLALAAAGATSQMPLTTSRAATFQAAVVEPLPPIPDTIPLSDVPLAPAPAVVTPDQAAPDVPHAQSLVALVRLHSSSETADREQECLAAATYFEAKSEPLDGQLAVANVILNRAESGRFASTACGVVLQRGQFSFVRGGALPPVARNSTQWRNAVAIARIAEDHLWEAPAQNALYFHAKRVSPGWHMTRVAAVGNHVFYR